MGQKQWQEDMNRSKKKKGKMKEKEKNGEAHREQGGVKFIAEE